MVRFLAGAEPVLFRLIMMRMEVYSMFYIMRNVLIIKRSEKTKKKREDKLLYLAQTDTMTGISNRRSREKMIERVLNNKVSGMMCLVDCDKFKSINDMYGHMAGDEVIVAIAHTLQKSCRDKDVVMRLGGDEFALFIPGVTDRKCANAFFKRLFENLKQIQIESIKDHPIIMSLGLAFMMEKKN